MAKATWDSLYSEHRDVIHRICLGMLRNADDAEDAVHETFARVLPRVDALAGEPRAYLVAAAQNVCRTMLRRRSRAVPAAESPAGTCPEQEAVTRLLLESVWERMDGVERAIAVDSMSGWSRDHTARATGISTDALAQRISRARRRLRHLVTAPALAGTGAVRRWRPARLLDAFGRTALEPLQSGLVALVPCIVAVAVGTPAAATGGAAAAGSHLAAGAVAARAVPGLIQPVAQVQSMPGGVSAGERAGSGSRSSPSPSPSSVPPSSNDASLLAGPPPDARDTQFASITPSPDRSDPTVFATSRPRSVPCVEATWCVAVYRSPDSGATWSLAGGDAVAFDRLLLPPSFPTDPAIYAASPSGLQASRDGARTFTTLLPVGRIAAVDPASRPGADRLLLTGATTSTLDVYTAADGRLLPGPALPPGVAVQAISFVAPGEALVLATPPGDASTAELLRCDATCQLLSTTPGMNTQEFVVSPTFASDHTVFLWAADLAHIAVSSDGGTTVRVLPQVFGGAAAAIMPDGDFAASHLVRVAAFASGTTIPSRLWESRDGGASFTITAAHLDDRTMWLLAMVTLPGGDMLVPAMYDPADPTRAGIMRSGDGGSTWRVAS